MLELNLTTIHRFHTMVRQISEAGIELDLFGSKNLHGGELESRLMNLEMRCGSAEGSGDLEGEKLLQVLRQESEVADKYIPGLLSWLSQDGAAEALYPLAKETIERKRYEGHELVLFFYPLLWGISAGFVLLFVCFILAPNFIALAEQLRHQSILFNAMYWVRDSAAWLLPIYVLLFTFCVWCYLRSSFRRVGIRGKQRFLRRATQAEQYAVLASDELPLLELSDSSGLLGWAASADDGEQRKAKLEFASQVYVSVHDLENRKRGSLAPTKLAVVAGGFLVALVGAFVFGPIVELMFLVIQSAGGNG